MNEAVEYLLNKASEEEIAEHLRICDADFVPPLSVRVGIKDYAIKIAARATRFEAWSGGALVGLVAAYCNDQAKRIVYITSVSVLKEWAGKGIASNLMSQCIEYAESFGMRRISLEVAVDNTAAIRLYEKSGFIAGKVKEPFVTMDIYLENR